MLFNMEKDKRKKLVLFDIDNTLLVGNRAHWTAYQNAFKKVFDVILPEDFPPWSGYTELKIIYSLMDMYHIERDEEKANEIVGVMIDEFLKQDQTGTRILPGVERLLYELKDDEDMIIGLVTGNIEDIAYSKLKHLKIDEYFVLGGFGEISEIRSDLVHDAIRKAEGRFGKIDKKDVFIIGDTIHDIRAAKEAGVKVIAVATGHQNLSELKGYDPDFLFESLDDEKVLEVIKHG